VVPIVKLLNLLRSFFFAGWSHTAQRVAVLAVALAEGFLRCRKPPSTSCFDDDGLDLGGIVAIDGGHFKSDQW
jgi:hypothetical protein